MKSLILAPLVCLGLAVLIPVRDAAGWGETAVKKDTPTAPRTLRLPDKPYNYANLDLPAHFKGRAVQRVDNTPANNRITDAGATLGRVLFYDTRLSANNKVACASCHHQKNAFSDPNRFSKGHEGKETDRNAMPLVNIRYYPRDRFFWDERASTLEAQVLKPIQSKVEMGHDLDRLVELLGKDPAYPDLFNKAFGDPKVSKERLARALAQFVRSLVSYQSKFDEGRAKVDSVRADFPNFTAEENRGKTLFVQQCARCHAPDTAGFFMNRPRNNGLDSNPRTTDGGVGDVTLNSNQVGLFKSPSLRNVELTGPYMHDGRFDTLEKVIEHYSTGVKNHPNADGRLRRGLRLNTRQKSDLVLFLKTLTDSKFTTDPKFSDPFQ
jgi:cytochrome c peroxidase